jgi:undecaprenol kinase/diacylglycerol kinase (ATP)
VTTLREDPTSSAENQRRKAIAETLTGTMRIDPDQYSPLTSKSRTASLSYAIAGWLYMLRRQKNIRLQIAASLIVGALALWLRVDAMTWAILILTITIVWVAEFVNAAVEAAINLATQEIHPMARVGKDVAAAAVLLCVVASVLIGLLLLGPPLLQRLGWIS